MRITLKGSRHLKARLRDILTERDQDLDRRYEETPYDRALALWTQVQLGRGRRAFLRALEELLDDAVHQPWPPMHFHNLLALIELGRIEELIRPLEALAHSGGLRWRKDGVNRHVRVLRCLMALGWKGTGPSFWLDQWQSVLPRQHPELIFAGLSLHGADIAFQHLPDLASDAASARGVTHLFPTLVKQLSLQGLIDRIRSCWDRLRPKARLEIERWFEAHGVGRNL